MFPEAHGDVVLQLATREVGEDELDVLQNVDVVVLPLVSLRRRHQLLDLLVC